MIHGGHISRNENVYLDIFIDAISIDMNTIRQ